MVNKELRIDWKKVLAYGIAILYLLLPVDIIPESLSGVIGFIDDIVAFIIAYYLTKNKEAS
ncbi:MAG: DUF1232 domain-containing protein [Candidatus Hodarchaeales archaeon]